MRKVLATVLALALCVSACSAFAETKVSFFTGKIETVDLLNEIIDSFNAANPDIVVEQGVPEGRQFHYQGEVRQR